jgi:hypothetical protein
MTDDDLQSLIDDATFDYAMGDTDQAVEKLDRAVAAVPASFAAWHALAEINFSARRLDASMRSRLQPDCVVGKARPTPHPPRHGSQPFLASGGC